VRKPQEEQHGVPENIAEPQIRMRKARGKPTIRKMAGMQVRSKLDRRLARE